MAGANGQIHIGYIGKRPDKCVAIKLMDIENYEMKKIFENSILIMNKIQKKLPSKKRQHIIKLIDYGIAKRKIRETNQIEYGALIMELGTQTFGEKIYTQRTDFQSDQSFIKVIKELVLPLSELHQVAMHLDYKPENLVYVEEKNSKVLKVIDFDGTHLLPQLKGKKGMLANAVTENLKILTGTDRYNPPEFYAERFNKRLSTKTDIWAVGMMLYETLFLQNKYKFYEEMESDAKKFYKLLYYVNQIHRGFSLTKDYTKYIHHPINYSTEWLTEFNVKMLFWIFGIWKDFPRTGVLLTNLLNVVPEMRMSAKGILDFLDGECCPYELYGERSQQIQKCASVIQPTILQLPSRFIKMMILSPWSHLLALPVIRICAELSNIQSVGVSGSLAFLNRKQSQLLRRFKHRHAPDCMLVCRTSKVIDLHDTMQHIGAKIFLIKCAHATCIELIAVLQLSSRLNVKDYGCPVEDNVLRFFIVGDIGGEEYTLSKTTTVADQQQQCTVDSGEGTVAVHSCTEEEVKHRPTKAQEEFLLNTGDNFYEEALMFHGIQSLEIMTGKAKMEFNLKLNCLMANGPFPPNIMWCIITLEKTVPQIQVRFIMIDTTVLCGNGTRDFRRPRTTPEDHEKYANKIKEAKKQFTWLQKELREANRRRVHFLFMAYFAGHQHNLKHMDLETGVKFITSGAGSRMEVPSDIRRFLAKYQRSKVKKPKLEAFSTPVHLLELNATNGIAKFNFYAAGRLYHDDKTYTKLEEPHEFEETFEIVARDVKKIDENDNICDEFLALQQLVDDNEHFKRDNDNERMQDLLVYAEETFDALRQTFKISYRDLAESFLSDDLVEQNTLGKRVFRTMDKKFLLKTISGDGDVHTFMKTLPNTLGGKGKESSSNSILLVLRPVTEEIGQKHSELFAVIGGANDGKAK
uniref:Protein kinase domain-containing protein n=1 Tax=Globodera rostochiensis TaxID=31243 RepID=A0A914I140_GLORO